MTDIFMFMSFASVRQHKGNEGRTTRKVTSLRRLYEPPRQTASKKVSQSGRYPHAGDRVWPKSRQLDETHLTDSRIRPVERDAAQRFESPGLPPSEIPQEGGGHHVVECCAGISRNDAIQHYRFSTLARGRAA